MLIVLWPVAVVALVPVVAVEGGGGAAGDRRRVGSGVDGVAPGNLATTIVGVSVTGLLMLLVEFFAPLIGASLEHGRQRGTPPAVRADLRSCHGFPGWIGRPLVLAWLLPGVDQAIERRVGRRVLAEAAPEAIQRWSWWANGWSYTGLVLYWMGSV